MPSGSLKRFANAMSPSVAHFLRELTYHGAPNSDLPSLPRVAGTLPGTPTALLFFLYEPWRIHRGVSSWYKINSQRVFTSVLHRLEPERCGSPPVAPRFVVGKDNIPCLRVTLRKTPLLLPASEINPVVSETDNRPLGTASGPFFYPKKDQIPREILKDLAYLATCRTRRWDKDDNKNNPLYLFA